MRRAFTMIELIFSIVIIAILASVALPRLAVTRDDAYDAKDCKNIAVCVTDLLAQYTAKESAFKTNFASCLRAESSTHNTITIVVSDSNVTVSGAPHRCDWLNAVTTFGGMRID